MNHQIRIFTFMSAGLLAATMFVGCASNDKMRSLPDSAYTSIAEAHQSNGVTGTPTVVEFYGTD